MFGAVLVVIAGFGLAMMASRLAVQQAGKLAYGLSIPPFIIGVTFFAIGTDIPEIANSVMASLAGHGDLNVGDGSSCSSPDAAIGCRYWAWMKRTKVKQQ